MRDYPIRNVTWDVYRSFLLCLVFGIVWLNLAGAVFVILLPLFADKWYLIVLPLGAFAFAFGITAHWLLYKMGWGKLAKMYPAGKVEVLKTFHWETMTVGWTPCRHGSVVIDACAQGVRLRPTLALFARPILLPWDELKFIDVQMDVRRMVHLEARRVPEVLTIVSRQLADQLWEYQNEVGNRVLEVIAVDD